MAVVHRRHQRRDNIIEDATSDTYTPTEADATATVILMVMASYTDGQGQGAMKMADEEAAEMVAVDTRNKPPAFADQDSETDGTQNETATRKVAGEHQGAGHRRRRRRYRRHPTTTTWVTRSLPPTPTPTWSR